MKTKTLVALLANLRIDHWAWFHAKLALMFASVVYLVYTPDALANELGEILVWTVCTFVFIGCGLGIYGLILSTSQRIDDSRRGLGLELIGFILASCGLFSFFITQVILISTNELYFSRAAFTYALLAFLFARTAVVLKALSKRG